MAFVKAAPGVPSKGKVKQFCSVRLRESGNAQLTMSRGFIGRFFPGAKASDRFSVQWGTEADTGKAMIARVDTGELRGTDLRGAIALTCIKPAHAPRGERPSSLCRVISATTDAVLIELPEWALVVK